MTQKREHGRSLERLLLLVVLVAAATGSGACDLTGPRTPVGNYTLTTIDGKTVPVAVVADVDYKFEVLSGMLSLGADGSFSAVTQTRETVQSHASVFNDTLGGTWTRDHSILTLTASDSVVTTGDWNSGRITLALTDGSSRTSYVYARQ
jgi:hypothetical protein